MRRPVKIAVGAYLGLSALLLLGMGFVTRRAIAAEQAERLAMVRAELEENARLSLWRIDTEVASLLAWENSRPYFDYSAFIGTSNRFEEMTYDRYRTGRFPSPLLLSHPRYTLLHFQIEPGGQATSPQAPQGRAEALAGLGVSKDQVQTARTRLASIHALLQNPSHANRLYRDVERSGSELEQELSKKGVEKKEAGPGKLGTKGSFSSIRSRNEYSVRAKKVQQAALLNITQKSDDLFAKNGLLQRTYRQTGKAPKKTPAALRPVWIEDRLFLVRSVTVGPRSIVQAAWLDWESLKSDLLAQITDLLPGAELRRASSKDAEKARLLASLPVELQADPSPTSSRYRLGAVTNSSLILGWSTVILACAALAILLAGGLSLSERRATFVSAVTHELRTPLTTFRMYTEMLSEGMVTEEKRSKYLATLRREAVRLGHLVENVLAYAKIDQGGKPIKREFISVDTFLGTVVPRLTERAETSGLSFVLQKVGQVGPLKFEVDATAVEQILFNLTDNACKYGRSNHEPGLELKVRQEGPKIAFTVQDFGPGIEPKERRRLFRAFTKSAHQAASSAPGVGLGLALSLRLARAHRGDLVLDRSAGGAPGAAFTLWLPLR